MFGPPSRSRSLPSAFFALAVLFLGSAFPARSEGLFDDNRYCTSGLEVSSTYCADCKCFAPCEPGYEPSATPAVDHRCFEQCPDGFSDDGLFCSDVFDRAQSRRGAGSVPNRCTSGQEYDAGLCYPSCQSGYDGVGPVCWQRCPSGYRDDGASCWRTYSGTGNDDPRLIWKDSYGRGAGKTPTGCPSGRVLDEGLCYEPCPTGWFGTGIYCYEPCPAGYDDLATTCNETISKDVYSRTSEGRPRCESSDFVRPYSNDGTSLPFTMIVASDPQWPWWDGHAVNPADDSNEEVVTREELEDHANETNHWYAQAMNDITELGSWPSQMLLVGGEPVREPKAVIINGDLTALFHPDELDAYRSFYDPTYPWPDPAVLRLPLYPGLGNHDYHNDLKDEPGCGASGPQSCWEGSGDYGDLNRMNSEAAVRYMRGGAGCGSIANFDVDTLRSFDWDSLAYSWDVADWHFVQLHEHPMRAATAYQLSTYALTTSLAWLKADLAAATKDGLKIVLNMHDWGDDWSPAAEAEFQDAIEGTNVVAVFAGHLHGQSSCVGRLDFREEGGVSGTCPPPHSSRIPVYRSGSATQSRMLVAEFGDAYFAVASVDTTGGDPTFRDTDLAWTHLVDEMLCGNGALNLDEECDDGARNSDATADACRTTCEEAQCGDGTLDTGEECDEGAANADGSCADADGICNSDTAKRTCRTTCETWRCGDGVRDNDASLGEKCDDGNVTAGDGCGAGCGTIETGWTCDVSTVPNVCTPTHGDARVLGDEDCDDGNLVLGDGCDAEGRVEFEWVCDGAEPSACEFAPNCSNGVRQPGLGETCDDGNSFGRDGCSSACKQESGWTCDENGAGLSTCAEIVGDGVIRGDEACDDGNQADGDGCTGGVFDPGWTCTNGLALPGIPATTGCQFTCGDGESPRSTDLVVVNETCDDGGREPGDGCSRFCQIAAGWICRKPDPDGVSVCAVVHGDGIVAGDEECDDGNRDRGDGCNVKMRVQKGWSCSGEPSVCATDCGDGLLAGDEACDDGNEVGGDGCSRLCAVAAGWTCTAGPAETSSCKAIPNDGIVVAGEACDDGNRSAGDGCHRGAEEPGWTCDVAEPSVCRPICGDGLWVTDEACEDGNVASGDGCAPSCRVELGWSCVPGVSPACRGVPGDGLLRGTETCDDGDAAGGCSEGVIEPGWSCDGSEPTSCHGICGDGLWVSGEACEDGNTQDGDGCTSACAVEAGYGCASGDPSAACASVAGDGLVRAVEVCDDGNLDSGDGCHDSAVEAGWSCDDAEPSACTPICGDGIAIQAVAACDDGNLDAGDGCSPSCEIEPGWYCSTSANRPCHELWGDGRLVGSETCDDGNEESGDGCRAGFVEVGFTCGTSLPTACRPFCSDGIDNDGDGKTDHPADPECTSAADRYESVRACSNGLDDDRDGFVDFPADPGCSHADSNHERPMCQDGLDNQGDGTIDFDGGASRNGGIPLGPPDPRCRAPHLNAEIEACGLGAELAMVLGVLMRWRRSRGA